MCLDLQALFFSSVFTFECVCVTERDTQVFTLQCRYLRHNIYLKLS